MNKQNTIFENNSDFMQNETKLYEIIRNKSQSYKNFVWRNKTLVSFVCYESFARYETKVSCFGHTCDIN